MGNLPSRARRALACEKRACKIGAAVCLTLLYAVLLSFAGPLKSLTRFAVPADRTHFLLLTSLLLFAALLVLALKKRLTLGAFGLAGTATALALVLRLGLLDQVSADYAAFLERWVDIFREGGFAMIKEEIGDYNLPYLYILALIARSPLPDLYLIKLVSICFDFALALMMMQMTERFIDENRRLLVYLLVLVIPTVWWNSAYWAQCDALYVFFVVACFYALLSDRPVLSVALLTVAFAFKLQTIFFFPMVLFGLLHRKYKWRHAVVFPAVYLFTIVPALLAGRSLLSALTIYAHQSMGQYTDRLTYNAPNLYQFFPQYEIANAPQWPWLRFLFADPESGGDGLALWSFDRASMEWLQNTTLIAAALVVIAVVYFLWKRRRFISYGQVWRMATFSALFLPMVLPKMHDRYFYMADMFSLLYGVRYPRRAAVPMLVIGASFASYMPFLTRARGVPMLAAAVMNIAALALIARDILKDMRAQQSLAGADGAEADAVTPERV